MKPPNFEYVRADSLEHAMQVLSATRGNDVKLLAGGQSLVPLMNFRLARPRVLVDLNRIPGQSYCREADGRVEFGPLCRHRDLELNSTITSRCDAIREAVPLIGHVAVRQRGTVVGSFAHADPLAEWGTLGMLLDAVVRVESVDGSREVAAKDWFQGFYQTDIRENEVVTSVSIQLPETSGRTGTAFAEVTRRHGDFCLASAAALIAVDDNGRLVDVRLIVSGLKTVPWSLADRTSAYVGALPAGELWNRISDELPGADEVSADLHASGATRRAIAQSLARRVLASAAARADARLRGA